MFIFIVILHLLGWGLLAGFVLPEHLFGVGVGVTAYLLGVRHAFDIDHIAAIDSTTRKLLNEQRKPDSVGFWFSLGHSTVVVLLALGLALGYKHLIPAVSDDGSTLHLITGTIGPLVSGCFLLFMGLINARSLLGLAHAWKHRDDHEHEPPQGLMTRLFGRYGKFITQPWHMYPMGFLFGLGFDTATEVALLLLTIGLTSSGLPIAAIMALPILFTAGMCAFDTANGAFMRRLYSRTFRSPTRYFAYNFCVTSLTTAFAFWVGIGQLTGLAG